MRAVRADAGAQIVANRPWRSLFGVGGTHGVAPLKDCAVGFIAGQTAPPGRRMGHAGAIISGGQGTAKDKYAAMNAAGIRTVETPADLGSTLAAALK